MGVTHDKLEAEQHGCHFTDNIFSNWFSCIKIVVFWFKVSEKNVYKGPINDKPALV